MPIMTVFHARFSDTPEVQDPFFQGWIALAEADLGLFQVLKDGWES